ncbi:MAG: histidinol-phosphate aminotransferase family protein, partial [Anaerolineae bacterium]|nr:histidinol-phosphate aminotransferase family protein [Anaerolineae bacterium]
MLTRVEPAMHGALDLAELERLGLDPNDVLDFSVNSNPFGPSPSVLEAIRSTPPECYPDRESIALRRALSKHLGVSPEQILVGNGTAELIQLTTFAFLKRRDAVLIVDPTFGEYHRCVHLVGANLHRWRAVPENGFVPQATGIQKELSERKIRLVFICNPNNPTGQVLSLDVLNEWARAFLDSLFVVDEAYLAFVPEMRSAVSLRRKNILVLRSMTKDYALAGLRLGYAVGDKTVIAALTNLRPAWNVNALAQAAGLAALQDETYLIEALSKLGNEKEVLVSRLKELDYRPVPSRTHYFLLPVGNAAQIRQELLKMGILVRDCASFGLPSYVRIATRKPEENARLLE